MAEICDLISGLEIICPGIITVIHIGLWVAQSECSASRGWSRDTAVNRLYPPFVNLAGAQSITKGIGCTIDLGIDP